MKEKITKFKEQLTRQSEIHKKDLNKIFGCLIVSKSFSREEFKKIGDEISTVEEVLVEVKRVQKEISDLKEKNEKLNEEYWELERKLR